MTTSMDLFIKLAVILIKLLVAVAPDLKNNPIVAELLAGIDALHLSTMQPPH